MYYLFILFVYYLFILFVYYHVSIQEFLLLGVGGIKKKKRFLNRDHQQGHLFLRGLSSFPIHHQHQEGNWNLIQQIIRYLLLLIYFNYNDISRPLPPPPENATPRSQPQRNSQSQHMFKPMVRSQLKLVNRSLVPLSTYRLALFFWSKLRSKLCFVFLISCRCQSSLPLSTNVISNKTYSYKMAAATTKPRGEY